MKPKVPSIKEGFEVIEHPADIGFQAWAPSKSSLFAQAAIALNAVMFDIDLPDANLAISLEISGSDLEELMYNWLSEILYLFDGEKKVIHEFEVVINQVDHGLKLVGKLKGEKYDLRRHQIKTYIKAVTYHQLSVSELDGYFRTTVFLDV